MKYQSIALASALCLGLARAGTNFFEDTERAEIFELTELNMPTLRINFSDDSYNRFKLTYKCLYDTHPLIDNENEDCYTAPWIDYTELLNTLIGNSVVDTNKLSSSQSQYVNNTDITYDVFKGIVASASSLSLKDVFSQKYGYVTIPSFEEKKASLDFTVNG